MEELIQQITEKFNLPEETAQGIVKTVTDFLKDKLPEPIGSQLGAFLSSGDLAQQAQDLLGGLFGGQ